MTTQILIENMLKIIASGLLALALLGLSACTSHFGALGSSEVLRDWQSRAIIAGAEAQTLDRRARQWEK